MGVGVQNESRDSRYQLACKTSLPSFPPFDRSCECRPYLLPREALGVQFTACNAPIMQSQGQEAGSGGLRGREGKEGWRKWLREGEIDGGRGERGRAGGRGEYQRGKLQMRLVGPNL